MRLLFVTSNRIGDAVLSTGLLAALLARYPGAEVTVACGPVSAPLFGAVPGLKRLLLMPKQKYAGHWFKLWKQTVGQRWDLVVDLRSSKLSWFLAARQRLMSGSKDNSLHRVVELAQLLSRTDIPGDPPPAPTCWLATAHQKLAHSLMDPELGPPIIGFGPTANWGGKVWPADRFAQLAQRLTADTGPFPGARVAIFGAKGERLQASPLLAALPKDRTIDLLGKVDLPVASASLQLCQIYIGNDSGLMHMAAAAGTPTLGLFGPSPDARYRPWGKHCAFVRTTESYEELVNSPSFDHRSQESCMTSLSVDRVEQAVRDLWALCTSSN
ncbi:glycosyltransferase family 9 protein [Rhodovibrionaceae bacterium A322]